MINSNALQKTIKSYNLIFDPNFCRQGTIFHFDDMSYWIVHFLRFPLILDLHACHKGTLKMKKKIESQTPYYK